MRTKNKTLAAAIAFTSAIPSMVYAQDLAAPKSSTAGLYVTGQIGYSLQASDSEAIGQNIAVEGFYDFPNATAFTPYIKVGVGISDNSYSARLGGQGAAGFDPFDGAVDGYYDAYADGDSTQFSWNVGFGGNYNISQKFSLYGEYQYATFGDINTGQDAFTDGFKIDDIASHEVIIGLRYAL